MIGHVFCFVDMKKLPIYIDLALSWDKESNRTKTASHLENADRIKFFLWQLHMNLD